jgi:type III secretion protein N (ATPase)
MQNIGSQEHLGMAKTIRKWMADYKKSELLIRLGEYRPGIEPALDEAVRKKEPLAQWLSQPSRQARTWESTQASMRQLTER